ncbi:MAG: OmpA family protein [Proteobacteria bacterium]|nr:OmpA family protein [Pseudomonadota bacterium]MBU1739769.1 OmpA family protein [Pseudomonadota bacterium]
MTKNILLIITGVALLLSTPGCVMKSTFEEKDAEAKSLSGSLDTLQGEYNALVKERDDLVEAKNLLESALTGENKGLSEALAAEKDRTANLNMDLEELRSAMASQKDVYDTRIADLELTIEDLKGKLAKLGENYEGLKKSKEEAVQKMSATYGELIESMKGEIDKGQVTISELKGKLTVNMVDAVLFDSGKAEVKEEGLAVLQKVIDILMNVTDKAIRIEGHTDNVQIIGLLAQTYPTNWELSAARAINVARFLQKQGLDPASLSAVAYGEFKPVADNETPEGRAQNRRIEIILVAKE